MTRAAIAFRKLDARATLPRYMTAGAAGMDVSAVLDAPEILAPLQRKLIPTGLAVELPAGWEIQVRPRSGLAAKYGVTCLNSPGTIDSDYRGEIKVLLVNLSNEAFTVQNGERIAQLVVAEVAQVAIEERLTLSETVRGAGGFGHTGK